MGAHESSAGRVSVAPQRGALAALLVGAGPDGHSHRPRAGVRAPRTCARSRKQIDREGSEVSRQKRRPTREGPRHHLPCHLRPIRTCPGRPPPTLSGRPPPTCHWGAAAQLSRGATRTCPGKPPPTRPGSRCHLPPEVTCMSSREIDAHQSPGAGDRLSHASPMRTCFNMDLDSNDHGRDPAVRR